MLLEIFNYLLPCHCVLCGAAETTYVHLCAPCLQDLPFLTQSCIRCAEILSYKTTDHKLICGKCLLQPPPFDLAYSLFKYQGPLAHLLIHLKFNHQLAYAKLLGMLLAYKIKHEWYLHQPLPDVILPMPLHAKRLSERGYNQALEIARPIAKLLQKPLNLTGLIRHKHTLPQTGLLAEERRKNLNNAFSVKENFDGKQIALVDDVMTTGQTSAACARVLKQNGAKSIHVWCCARR